MILIILISLLIIIITCLIIIIKQKQQLNALNTQKNDSFKCEKEPPHIKPSIDCLTNLIIANGHLTQREGEVLSCFIQGMSAKETARHLNISLSTVGTHVASCYRKLNIHSRRDLELLVRKQASDLDHQ